MLFLSEDRLLLGWSCMSLQSVFWKKNKGTNPACHVNYSNPVPLTPTEVIRVKSGSTVQRWLKLEVIICPSWLVVTFCRFSKECKEKCSQNNSSNNGWDLALSDDWISCGIISVEKPQHTLSTDNMVGRGKHKKTTTWNTPFRFGCSCNATSLCFCLPCVCVCCCCITLARTGDAMFLNYVPTTSRPFPARITKSENRNDDAILSKCTSQKSWSTIEVH